MIGEIVRNVWARVRVVGAIGPTSREARDFGSFGEGSIICFPQEGIVNPKSIHLGSGTMIGPHCVLSTGWMPGQTGLLDEMLRFGDRCLLGKGSSIVCHYKVTIGDDVWTGHNVYITDMNHGYEDPNEPISRQHQPPEEVTIGDGSWLGHGTVVLPGSKIGRHVVIGAGSVVTGEIPDYSVAVGSPARVIKRLVDDAWISV